MSPTPFDRFEEKKTGASPASEKNRTEPEARVETKAVPETAAEPKILVTHTDAYIHDRIKAQPKSLKEIDVKVEEKINPNQHRLSLPHEFEELKRKYAFRWIFKSKRAIDEACDQRGWILFSRIYFPDFPGHFFSVNGTFERGDNILAFMKRERAEELRKKYG
jgi:hypothetical protein